MKRARVYVGVGVCVCGGGGAHTWKSGGERMRVRSETVRLEHFCIFRTRDIVTNFRLLKRSHIHVVFKK